MVTVTILLAFVGQSFPKPILHAYIPKIYAKILILTYLLNSGEVIKAAIRK